MFCQRIVAVPEMVEALEYAYEQLSQNDTYAGDLLLAKIFGALKKAKGGKDPCSPNYVME